MIEVEFDAIALSDDEAISALVKMLGLKHLYNDLDHLDTRPDFAAHWAAQPHWKRYFYGSTQQRHWRNEIAYWLEVDVKRQIIGLYTLKGLANKREADALYTEGLIFSGQAVRAPTPDELKQIWAVISNPSAYLHQDMFEAVVANIHKYFEWQGTEVVDGPGNWVTISQSGLPEEDIELLREVFKRLPPYRKLQFDGGEHRVRMQAAADTKKARKTVNNFVKAASELTRQRGELAAATFDLWALECLQAKTTSWTRSTSLYQHYKRWLMNGGSGQNRVERAEVNSAVLSNRKWGIIMHMRFVRSRDGRGHKYQVTIKGGA